ncbi:MAG: hypothetical protein OQK98_14260 [Gammaproteobacteria bacterium]|nr:hypothetical protein [Gammaproteobacteria bacterium]
MKKAYLLTFAVLLSTQAMAAEEDSVYTWGAWAEGIQPAAGPVARVTPPPAQTPNINFRPNENSAFLREASTQARFATAPISVPVSSAITNQVNVIPITPSSPISPTGPSTGGF